MVIEEKKLKNLMKSALKEVLKEDRKIFYEVIADVIEDIAMARAIEEGMKTKKVSKERILRILKNAN